MLVVASPQGPATFRLFLGTLAVFAAPLLSYGQADPSVADDPVLEIARCSVGEDRDLDGMSDRCERALAARFAPELVVSTSACNWNGERLSGEYVFGVQWIKPQQVARLIYMPAYLTDCGWSGPKCWLRLLGGCQGHPGDSETIAVEAVWMDQRWVVTGVFLSAHCFGRTGGDCRWYRGAELDAFSWTGSQRGSGPFVWVAEGKNANYPTRQMCDRGHHWYDTCDRNDVTSRFLLGRNVGSRQVPFGDGGCVQRRQGEQFPNDRPERAWSGLDTEALPRTGEPRDAAGARDAEGHLECFWTDRPFRGWSREASGGETPYLKYIELLLDPPTAGSDQIP